MNFIYDILLNFNDSERLVEFFEWNEDDFLEHIKKIPIYRIPTNQMKEICENQILISNEFLKEIENQTIAYQKIQHMKYATILCDLNKAVALEFLDNGNVISRSTFLIDEEDAILEETTLLQEVKLKYKIIRPLKIDYYLTREEMFIKKYLLKELEFIVKTNNILKLNFIYEEIFKKDKLSFEKKVNRLIKNIENNFCDKHRKLYEIVRLTYIKK